MSSSRHRVSGVSSARAALKTPLQLRVIPTALLLLLLLLILLLLLLLLLSSVKFASHHRPFPGIHRRFRGYRGGGRSCKSLFTAF